MNIQNAKNVEKFEDVNKSHEKSMLVNNTCQTDSEFLSFNFFPLSYFIFLSYN